jgi:hypothetical protein
MSPNVQTAFLFEGFNGADHGFNTQPCEVGNVLADEADLVLYFGLF